MGNDQDLNNTEHEKSGKVKDTEINQQSDSGVSGSSEQTQGILRKSHTTEIRETVLRVQKLVIYATETGKPVDEKTQKIIVSFIRKVVNGEDWTTDEESDFWKSSCELSSKLAPVTYDTLKSSKKAARYYVLGLWYIYSLSPCIPRILPVCMGRT